MGKIWSQWQNLFWSESHSVMSKSLRPHVLYPPWNSPGQNTGVGSLSLLQGIFPTQGLNLDLSHCRWILYQLSYKGSLPPRPPQPFILFCGPPKSQMVTAVMKLKYTYSLEEKLWKPRQCIKKQRHHFANKGPYSKSYGFPVVMYGCES